MSRCNDEDDDDDEGHACSVESIADHFFSNCIPTCCAETHMTEVGKKSMQYIHTNRYCEVTKSLRMYMCVCVCHVECHVECIITCKGIVNDHAYIVGELMR